MIDRDALPGGCPILVGEYLTGHRITSTGPACGSRERTVRSTVNAAAGYRIPPCVPCWGGGRPW